MHYHEALKRLRKVVQDYVGVRCDVTELVGLEPAAGCQAVKARYDLIFEAARTASFADVSTLAEELDICSLFYAIYHLAQTNPNVPITGEDIVLVEEEISMRIHDGGTLGGQPILTLAKRLYPNTL